MTKPHEYRRLSHCVYLCDYHIVYPTKYRHSVITDEIWSYLYGKLVEVTTHYPKLYIKEANHDTDHVHILISIPPQMPVGRVVGLLKTNTSRGIKEKFPVLKKATGVSMVFGRMATLSRRSVLPQTLSDVILKIRANWMRVKELRSLTDRRVASVFIPCGVSPGFLIFLVFFL